nr:MAG TPA: hypothetical protein [Bacteriophage sp.]
MILQYLSWIFSANTAILHLMNGSFLNYGRRISRWKDVRR